MYDFVFTSLLEAADYADQLFAVTESVDVRHYKFAAAGLRGYLALARGDYPQAESDCWQPYQLGVGIDPDFAAVPFALAGLADVAR
ncbi:MAG: hypothetical protein HC802_00455 [Caldilineaceae bacterium]|nr:hypothetical protein [Caldilineaceae bacterium]